MKLESSSSAAKLSLQAIVDTLPLAIAVIPWGILTGAIAIQIGLTPVQAQVMSLCVFAGAAQLSSMTLMASGASTIAIFGSTFVISARHLLYSVVLRENMLNMPWYWRASVAFVLTDEMFAVSQANTQRTGIFSALFALVSGITFYVVWNLATLAGIIAGDSLGNLESLGLDFAIAATFIAMTFDQLRRFPIFVAVFVSGVLAVLLKSIFADSYIIIASLLGMLAAFIVDHDPVEEGSS